MILLQRPTMTQMWHDACAKMFFGHKDDRRLDLQKGSSMTMTFRNVLVADSMEFDLDVWYDLHLTHNRFPVLQRTYLKLDELESFFVRCENVAKQAGAVTKLHATPHKPKGINRTKKTGNYAHGGCIHGWDFRIDKGTKKPELAMHSRVSYLPYMGGLDLALSYCIAKEVAPRLGYQVEDFSFVWYCSGFQFAHMQSVAYCWNQPSFRQAIDRPKRYPDADYPTIKLMRATIKSFEDKKAKGFTPEQEKYAQLMRYRRRWEARVDGNGQWKSVPLSSLNLNSIRATAVVLGDDNEVVEYDPHA